MTSKEGRGGRRYLPYVFTEQGIAMLSAVLRSDIAIQVSIRIMETFVEMRKYMGYTEESMRSMRYKMSVYDDFTEEYDYRVKYNRNHSSEEQLKAQAEQQIITPVRRRGRGR